MRDAAGGSAPHRWNDSVIPQGGSDLIVLLPQGGSDLIPCSDVGTVCGGLEHPYYKGLKFNVGVGLPFRVDVSLGNLLERSTNTKYSLPAPCPDPPLAADDPIGDEDGAAGPFMGLE